MITDIASQLRAIRKHKRKGQHVPADALGISVSEISRLERGLRKLRVNQLPSWLESLGYRGTFTFWQPAKEQDPQLDENSRHILSEVAKALPHLPDPAREALVHSMRVWSQAS